MDRTLAEDAALALCLPELRAAEDRLRSAAADVGISYRIPGTGAWRSSTVQAGLVKVRDAEVAAGLPYYDVAQPGHSFHEAGAAFDVALTNDAGMDDGVGDDDPRLIQLAELAAGVGLRAGYYFTHPQPDPYHFELPVDLAVAQAEYANVTTQRLATGGAAAVAVLVAVLLLSGVQS